MERGTVAGEEGKGAKEQIQTWRVGKESPWVTNCEGEEWIGRVERA